MRVCVFGLWHLGCVTAACVAEAGHDVIALDLDEAVVAGLQTGTPPLFEPGLADLLQADRAVGRLEFTTDLSRVADADVLWVCHDTPVDEDDRADVAYVVDQVSQTFPHLRDGAVVLTSAQLPVGKTEAMERGFAEQANGRAVSFAYSPENLRLGRALENFRNPGRIVVGIRDDLARQKLDPLLSGFCDRILWMSAESAEMVKHALNAFLAVSVTFTNEIAAICEKVGADASEVEKALRSEPRIGEKAYIRPGPAFAGGTLARDIQFLSAISDSVGVSAPLIDGVIPSNRAHQNWAIKQLRNRLGSLSGRRIAVLGLAYKPGTDTLRRSTAVDLLNDLIADDANIRAFDPAVRWLPENLGRSVELAGDLQGAIDGAEAVVIATEWPEFRGLGEADLTAAADGCLVLDPGGCLSSDVAASDRINVVRVGSPL